MEGWEGLGEEQKERGWGAGEGGERERGGMITDLVFECLRFCGLLISNGLVLLDSLALCLNLRALLLNHCHHLLVLLFGHLQFRL